MVKPHIAYQAFDKDFFSRNQWWILWLLNAPLLKLWFRWAMRIPEHDCAHGKKIYNILPHALFRDRKPVFENGEWRLQQTAVFFGYPKYSRRIYYALWPVWWLAHAWDGLIADSFWPELSFGFSTLTVNPQAGSGGSNVTCDGVGKEV